MDKLKDKVGGVLHGGEGKHNSHAQQQQPLKPSGDGENTARQTPHHPPLPSKRGLCWPNENKTDDITRFTHPASSKISWYYNWSPHAKPSAPSALRFVPMQWNAGGIGELAANVERVNAKFLMAFNEPELGDQANMSPEVAAREWVRWVEPLRKKGVRCGSPAITNSGGSVQWMRDFWGRIKKEGSDVDFWCLHWYGPEIGPFYDHIWSTHHQLDKNKKVWITEFAATNWNEAAPLPKAHVENFAREAFKYLDSLDWVERYCWFAPTREIGNVGRGARMYNDEGNLTELGKMFRDG